MRARVDLLSWQADITPDPLRQNQWSDVCSFVYLWPEARVLCRYMLAARALTNQMAQKRGFVRPDLSTNHSSKHPVKACMGR